MFSLSFPRSRSVGKGSTRNNFLTRAEQGTPAGERDMGREDSQRRCESPAATAPPRPSLEPGTGCGSALVLLKGIGSSLSLKPMGN